MCQHIDIIVKEFENKKKFALTDFIRSFCIDSAKESSLLLGFDTTIHYTNLKEWLCGGRLFEGAFISKFGSIRGRIFDGGAFNRGNTVAQSCQLKQHQQQHCSNFENGGKSPADPICMLAVICMVSMVGKLASHVLSPERKIFIP